MKWRGWSKSLSDAGDERRALLLLYQHPNVQVRLAAAKATLALAPDAARRMLQTIADSRAQDEAQNKGNYAEYNQLFRQMRTLEQELKERPGDQRRELLTLYQHTNAQVRLMAAEATLTVAPQVAHRMLRTIADSREYPQAGHAGMSLYALERGIFKPT
jgi:hypothetical protein